MTCRVKQNTQQGFSLLELTVVIVIIGFLATASLQYYEKILDDARRTGLEVMASQFTASIALIRGRWIVESSIQVEGKVPATWHVDVDNVAIFLNEYGWPANTEGNSPLSSNQSAEECRQLWMALFQNPMPVSVAKENSNTKSDNQSTKGEQRYHVSQVNHHVCRYELVGADNGEHFFDYDLKSGTVMVTAPPRK
ncbi:MSHA fimbrial major subunit MshB [Aurantivibrio infirmus]